MGFKSGDFGGSCCHEIPDFSIASFVLVAICIRAESCTKFKLSGAFFLNFSSDRTNFSRV
jgi:hypothetical protein